MNKTYNTIVLGFLAVGLLAACSSNSSSDAVDVSAKYQGNYTLACTSVGSGEWTIEELALTGLTGTMSTTDYSDDQCTNPIFTGTVTADLSFPGGTQTTERGEADFVDIVLTSATQNGVAIDLSLEPASELMEFDIVVLEGVNLYFGDTEADEIGDSPETRPTTIEQIPFVRQ